MRIDGVRLVHYLLFSLPFIHSQSPQCRPSPQSAFWPVRPHSVLPPRQPRVRHAQLTTRRQADGDALCSKPGKNSAECTDWASASHRRNKLGGFPRRNPYEQQQQCQQWEWQVEHGQPRRSRTGARDAHRSCEFRDGAKQSRARTNTTFGYHFLFS